MPRISIKKILILLVVIITLSQLHKIAAVSKDIFGTFYDCFEPLRNSPPLGKYVVAIAALVLLYMTIVTLLRK